MVQSQLERSAGQLTAAEQRLRSDEQQLHAQHGAAPAAAAAPGGLLAAEQEAADWKDRAQQAENKVLTDNAHNPAVEGIKNARVE